MPGDIAYNTMRMWEGRSALAHEAGLVSPAYTVCVPLADQDGEFFAAYFKTAQAIEQFRRFSQGLVKDTLSLKFERFAKIRLYTATKNEQRKIAACLGSLDAWIAAEARRLEALRRHKTGLMQQLFPRPGETRPRLRFPEFRNVGEWKPVRLSKLGHLVGGLTYRPDDVRDLGLLVLRSSNVQRGRITFDDCVYVRPDIKGANPARTDDILICVRNGSKALIGKNALIPKNMPPATHGAFMTIFRAKEPRFTFYLFQTQAYRWQVAADLGATINSINGKQLLRYKFRIPEPAEQRRVADCLASLDALLSAQAEKLAALRQHKRGLMQRLFPSPDHIAEGSP